MLGGQRGGSDMKCAKCSLTAIENNVLGKAFFYCRGCKQELVSASTVENAAEKIMADWPEDAKAAAALHFGGVVVASAAVAAATAPFKPGQVVELKTWARHAMGVQERVLATRTLVEAGMLRCPTCHYKGTEEHMLETSWQPVFSVCHSLFQLVPASSGIGGQP